MLWVQWAIVIGVVWVTISGMAWAQDTLYAVSGMGAGQHVSAARLQAQFAQQRDVLQRVERCGNAGKLYGPTHPDHDADGCVQAGAAGGTALIGAAESKSANTTYVAAMPGIVVATSSNCYISGVLNGVTIAQSQADTNNAARCTLTFPVALGNTWRVTVSTGGGTKVNWFPFGSGS